MVNRTRLTFILLAAFLVALASSPPQAALGAATSNSLQIAPITAQPSDAWWNVNWEYRKQHVILGSTVGAQTNYPLSITLHRTVGSDNANDVYVGTKCQSDFDDIRFTTDGPSPSELDYWIGETNSTASSALMWVEVPYIPASPGTCTIYLYYGNALASGVSNGDNTFIFFDDFEDGVVNPAKWLEHNMDLGASFSESEGKLRLTDTTTEADPWGVIQGLMAQSGGAAWNPPENSFRITLDDVHWNSTDPDINKAQGNWGATLSGSKNPSDLAAGDLSIFMNDAWIAATGRVHSSEDDEQHSFNSAFVPHQATCDFLIYKNSDNTVDTFYNQTQALINEVQTNVLNYLVVVYSGDSVLNYEDLTVETFIFQKWVDPEPSHATWSAEETDPTPPAWSPVPVDQSCEFGLPFSYDLNATDSYGLDDWWLNDTAHFKVNSVGLIQNATKLSVGHYGLQVWVNNTKNNIQTAAFTVTVEDTTVPIWAQAPTGQVLAYGQSLDYQVSATDAAGIARWTINDTTHFAVNNGRITNVTALLPGRYALLVTAYDPSDNYCAAMFTVTVQAPTTPTTPPIPGFPFASIGAGLLLASLCTVLAKRQSRGRHKPQ